MADAIARIVIDEAQALRKSHPQAPSIDVLDLVMKGRENRHIDFGDEGLPPSPFGVLLADALDGPMTGDEWFAMTQPDRDPQVRSALLVEFALIVVPRFRERYGLG